MLGGPHVVGVEESPPLGGSPLASWPRASSALSVSLCSCDSGRNDPLGAFSVAFPSLRGLARFPGSCSTLERLVCWQNTPFALLLASCFWPPGVHVSSVLHGMPLYVHAIFPWILGIISIGPVYCCSMLAYRRFVSAFSHTLDHWTGDTPCIPT